MSRGRDAETPTDVPPSGWKDILWRVKDGVSEDRVGLIAAGVAFYGFLAFFPAIAALVAVSGLMLSPDQVTSQIESLQGVVPEDIIQIAVDQAIAVAGSQEGGLGLTALIGLALALYSASKGMGALMDGLNVVYGEEEERGFVKLKLWTFALTLFLIFGLLVAIAAMTVMPIILDMFALGAIAEPLIAILTFVILGALTIGGLAVLYRYGPSRDNPEWSWVSVGGVVACVIWIVASAGFAFYVSTFGSYNESFGTLAGVVILLTWMWLSAFIILLGGELNAEMEAQTRHDTTVGRDQPMGTRDAVKADRLGTAQA